MARYRTLSEHRFAFDETSDASDKPLLDTALPDFEKTLIEIAMAKTNGHRQEAAKLLGWGRNTLARKMKALHLD